MYEMLNREAILQTLKANNIQIQQFGVRSIGLFGSFLRGEQTDQSDIDLLIDFDPAHENFDNLMGLSDFIEQLFGKRRVEIVTKTGLSPYIGPRILEEVEYA